VYPDVFLCGVSLMGVPCGCWADGYNDTTGSGSTAQWSGPCAGGDVTKTGSAWGDLVRSYYPGYTGHRPRLQHWHGTADTTLNYKNLAEDVKEWTNLLGLAETPTATDMPKSGTTHQVWKNECGYAVYETFSLSGVGHSVPFDGAAVATYFGLDQSRESDPETAACGGGMGGAAGAGGVGAAGGTAAAGRAAIGGTGGAPGTAGASTGGVPGIGGMGAGSGGASNGAAGGASDSAGRGAATAGVGGAGGAGVTNQAGQSAAIGGVPSVDGQAGRGVATSSAGNAPSAGTSAGNGTGHADPAATGCGCVVGGRTGERLPAAAAFVFAALVLVRRRRLTEGVAAP
jgi:MYXO-CTERM domain-containing protein